MEQHSITLAHREYVEAFTRKHLPYSDFNFISLFSWNTEQHRVSELNGNLVVRFSDYITGEPFYSFIGENKVNETADHLLIHSQKDGCKSKLMLIPEMTAIKLNPAQFFVEESRDHFDYVYDTAQLAGGAGGRFSKYRAKFQNFERLYVEPYPSLVKIEIGTLQNKKDHISAVNEAWKQNKMRSQKTIDSTDTRNEELAVKRIFEIAAENLLVITILHRDFPIAYAINELLEGPYAITHFAKADIGYEGSSQYLMRKNCEILHFYNKQFVNHEQDLGLSGLRQSKESFRPAHFLRKYSVSRA